MNKKELQKLIAEKEAEADELRKQLNLLNVSVGQHYRKDNDVYVVAQIDMSRTDRKPYVLINIDNGIRWDDPVHDISDVFGGSIKEFTRVKGFEISEIV